MKHWQVLECVLVLALVLGGCATLPRGPGCVAAGPHATACLLPPATLPATDAEHLVSVRRSGQVQHYVGRLHIGPRRLELAMSSLLGMPLFSIGFDGRTVSSAPSSVALPANLVVLVLEAAVADPARLRPGLHGMQLSVVQSSTGEIRTLTERGHRLARIQRSRGPLRNAHITIDIDPAHTVLTLKPIPGAP